MSDQPIITRPIDPYQQYQYQQPPNYQPVNPYQHFNGVQPQVIVVEKPAPVEVKPTKIEKSPSFSSHNPHPFNRINSNLLTGIGLIVVVFLFWGHKAVVADAQAEGYKRGFKEGQETAQYQIQQAVAAKEAAEAQSAAVQASLGQIQQVIAETQKPLIQLGVVNK